LLNGDLEGFLVFVDGIRFFGKFYFCLLDTSQQCLKFWHWKGIKDVCVLLLNTLSLLTHHFLFLFRASLMSLIIYLGSDRKINQVSTFRDCRHFEIWNFIRFLLILLDSFLVPNYVNPMTVRIGGVPHKFPNGIGLVMTEATMKGFTWSKHFEVILS